MGGTNRLTSCDRRAHVPASWLLRKGVSEAVLNLLSLSRSIDTEYLPNGINIVLVQYHQKGHTDKNVHRKLERLQTHRFLTTRKQPVH